MAVTCGPPRLVLDISLAAAIALLVALMALVIRLVHMKINRRLEAAEASEDIPSGDNLESRAVGFRYIL